LDWDLKVDQLAFKHVEGNHSGANIGRVLVEIVDYYGIREKVRKYCLVNQLVLYLSNPSGRMVHS
jgi:hypothetical protein